ncbi:MAG TPA: carbamoyltransferase [Bdellovibrio sp.]
MKILGISAFYHDSAAALVVDGEVVAAAQEERFSRKKFDAGFPEQSIRFCLKKAGLAFSDLDEIVYYEKPWLSFERLLESLVATAPFSWGLFLGAMPIWMREKLNTRGTILKKIKNYFPQQNIPPITFSEHHLSHAASAFFPSPFKESAILCLDGVGEWATTSAWVGKNNNIESLWELHFPHSLGLLYSAFTHFCGFKVNSGEYKLMGLAPYGKPLYADTIKKHLIDIKDDGSFRLNLRYFPFSQSMKMTNQHFARLFGVAARTMEGPMLQVHKDLAASIQKVTEEILVKLARHLQKQTGQKNLCLAGGVALNCVANGLLVREKIFENIWVQPAAGDSGGALGAALASYYLQHHHPRNVQKTDSMKAALLGPSYSDTEILEVLERCKVSYQRLDDASLLAAAVTDLKAQKVLGWFQGAMEYGPRALGNRSILGDPRDPDMQSRMNIKIKFRESFRPFAPVVLADKVADIYREPAADPYMLFVSHVKSEYAHSFPAVTHVDGSARIQKIDDPQRRLFHLLKSFEKDTGCPLLINTSFNVRGEPIVCSPFEALRCFVHTDMDCLYLGNFRISKERQTFNRQDALWNVKYELD